MAAHHARRHWSRLALVWVCLLVALWFSRAWYVQLPCVILFCVTLGPLWRDEKRN